MSISHSWNGTVLTITSDSGTSSADLKGDMGIRGPQGPAGAGTATEEQIAQAVADYLAENPAGGGMTKTEKDLILALFRNAAYTSANMGNALTQLETLWNGSGEDSGGGEEPHSHSYTSAVTKAATCTTAGVRTYTCNCGHSYTQTIPATGHKYANGVCTVCGAADPTYNPDVPEPEEPEVTLTSISATYSGGDVAVGTAVSSLSGVVVTAHYSNGTSATVVGYTLSGTIAEGNNTITVTYEGKTTTFAVVGVATEVSNETKWADGVAYTFTPIEKSAIDTNTGAIITDTWSRTPYLYCAGASILRYTLVQYTSMISGVNEYCNGFYDADKNFISKFHWGMDGTSQDKVGTTKDITVPENAVYFITSHKPAVFRVPHITITPYE